jgi:hypothetical protein
VGAGHCGSYILRGRIYQVSGGRDQTKKTKKKTLKSDKKEVKNEGGQHPLDAVVEKQL